MKGDAGQERRQIIGTHFLVAYLNRVTESNARIDSAVCAFVDLWV